MAFRDRLQTIFSPYSRQSKELPSPEVHSLGAQGRESVDNPHESWYDTEIAPSLKPGAVRRTLALEPLQAKQITKRPVSEIISDFINRNSDLSFAVRSYIDFTISDFELDTDNDKSRRRIENFISDMETGSESFLGFLKRVFYGVYVEGASSVELNWSKDKKRPISISYVPPFGLEFLRAYDAKIGYGRYYKIVQYVGPNYRKPIVLQDRANPNPYYRYTPVNLTGTNPYGESSVEPALWGVVGRSQLMGTLIGFIQGQITPKGVFSPDLRAILSASPNMNLTAPQILQYGNEVAEVVRQASSGGDLTQNMISSFPILYQVVGAMTQGTNFEPLPVLDRVFGYSIQMGARLPSILFQPENLRTGIGDQKTRIDWSSFNDRCLTAGHVVRDDITRFFDLILMGDRSMTDEYYEPDVVLKLKRNDAEIRRMEAEALKLRMEAYKEVKELGVFTERELRRIVVEGRIDLDDFPVDRPVDTTAEEMMATLTEGWGVEDVGAIKIQLEALKELRDMGCPPDRLRQMLISGKIDPSGYPITTTIGQAMQSEGKK